MIRIVQNKYNIGDIVFVGEYNYSNESLGENHLFVIIDDDNKVVPLDYFGLIVSSHIEKSKKKNKYIYNEPLLKSDVNNLLLDSIVKCDDLFTLPSKNIKYKIGTVEIDDFLRFITAYNNKIKSTATKITS